MNFTAMTQAFISLYKKYTTTESSKKEERGKHTEKNPRKAIWKKVEEGEGEKGERRGKKGRESE